AGTWAADGQPVSRLARMVAADNGVDVSGHRAQSLTPFMVKNSDLILCMTPQHKQDLLQIFPHVPNRIFTLKEYMREFPPQKTAVDDPIGMNLNFYRRIFNEINEEIKRIWPFIRKRALVSTTFNNQG
ncbi:MAG: hypothetical protein WAN36_14055, partial [Calditrichia bacterium]